MNLRDLEDSKVFEIDEETKESLVETDNRIYIRPLPFEKFFIDSEINIGGTNFCGFLVTKSGDEILIKTFADFLKNKEIPEFMRRQRQMVIVALEETKKGLEIEKQIQNVNKAQGILKNLKQKEEIKKFVCNFLDFLNHPEVEMRVVKWFNNDNRIKKGKLPIPDRVKITIDGKLFRYIYETLPNMKNNSSPSYSFWVRGHYMHFWDKGKWNRVYGLNILELKENGYQIDEEDGLIKRWIFAFIKGEGKPKEVIRLVKNKVRKTSGVRK